MDVTRKDIKNVLGELKKIREHLEQLHQEWHKQVTAINAAEESREKNRDVKPFWVDEVLAEYKQPEANRKTEAQEQTRIQKSFKRAAWCTFFATAAAFGAAAYYAHIASSQLEQMRHANELATQANAQTLEIANRQFNFGQTQLIYTQAANLTATASVSFPPSGSRVFLAISNFGHESATAIKVRANITKWSLGENAGKDRIVDSPKLVTIPAPYDLVAIQEPAEAGPNDAHRWLPEIPFNVSTEELKLIRDGDMFIQAKVSLDFFDGFRMVTGKEFCFRHMTFTPETPSHNDPGGGMVVCNMFHNERDSIIRAKKSYKTQ